MPENPDESSSEATTENPGVSAFSNPSPDQKDSAGQSNDKHHPLIPSNGKVQVLPHALSQRLHLPEEVEIVDPRFHRYSHRYLVQAFLATVTMLVILLFDESLADVALAAGLASSIVLLFVHPSAPAARARSVVGGHTLALLVGVGCSLLLYSSPMGEFIAQSRIISDLSLAGSVGFLIMVMAVSNTEHPPAAATVLGISMQTLDPLRIAVFIASVILLALIHFYFKSNLRDLI